MIYAFCPEFQWKVCMIIYESNRKSKPEFSGAHFSNLLFHGVQFFQVPAVGGADVVPAYFVFFSFYKSKIHLDIFDLFTQNPFEPTYSW